MRLGCRRPLERSRRHARAARRLQRGAAQGHRDLDASRIRRAHLCQVQADREFAVGTGLERGAAQGFVERDSRFRAVGRGAARRGQGTLQAAARGAGRAGAEVLRACARRDRRLRLLRERRRARRCARRREAGRPQRGASRRPRRPQADLAFPELLPCAAVRREPRAARDAVHRLRHARERARQAGARQQRADARAAAAAPGRGPPARLREPCRGLAGAEDGRLAAAGDGLSARPRTPRPPLRRARSRRAARVCGEHARPTRSASLGPAVREREAEGGALRVQRPGGQAVLHRAEGARRLVPHHRDAVRGQHPAGSRAGVAPERALLPHRTRGATHRPVLPRPLRAQRQAAGRLDGRRPRALGAPRRHAANAGGASRLQLRRAGQRQAGTADAR